jgi:hypothetical protein
MEVIDYTEQLQKHRPETNFIAAYGKGNLFLALSKLKTSVKRFDGMMGKYRLHDAILSTNCERENDDAWACIKYDDFTFYTAKEIKYALLKLKYGENLFDCFNVN